MTTPDSWHREGEAILAREQGREPSRPIHTVRGVAIGPEGVPYGTTHDMDCSACVASGASFEATPRSEAYWSS